MATALKVVTPMFNDKNEVEFAATNEQLQEIRKRGFTRPKADFAAWPKDAYEKATGKSKRVGSEEDLKALGSGWTLSYVEPPKPAASAGLAIGKTDGRVEAAIQALDFELRAALVSMQQQDVLIEALTARVQTLEDLIASPAPPEEVASSKSKKG